ncbi:molybdenum cofactor guanylyltransferase MobA [Paracoccus albus]|uniref:molybdenum cofactor guanylyltransferase MobA n=1 Tax=Paracoccus albus TaxID=3017784 RepID=UPI0022F025C2|nr:molybdenum cofactor guanylyltransferase MobA [Paracoccus albus]WBU60855.1 molybdenum cofactor guanylyltransferase MobA [Paracoccus albus]
MAALPAVILAGGRAMRMGGGDKVLLPLNGKPLLQHVLDRLRPQAQPIAISANGDAARFSAFGLPVLPDSLPNFPGPLAGILAAMDWASAIGAEAVVTAAGDTPFPPGDLVQRLREAGGSGLSLAADYDPNRRLRLHPVFGLWPVSLRSDLRQTLIAGQGRIRDFADRHDAVMAIFDGQQNAFLNVNTPDDLVHAATVGPMRKEYG